VRFVHKETRQRLR